MSIELEPPIAGPDGKPRQRKVRPARAKAQPEEKATAGNGAAPGDVAEGDGAAADGDFSESAPEPDAAKPPRPSVGKQETSGSCKMTTRGSFGGIRTTMRSRRLSSRGSLRLLPKAGTISVLTGGYCFAGKTQTANLANGQCQSPYWRGTA